jgi:translation initiation factor IF-3
MVPAFSFAYLLWRWFRISKEMRVNEEIRAREVRVVTEEGEQLGIFIPREALRLAQERGLDLVEVAPMAKPPVCRIMDLGKFKYEQSKREKDARKKHKIISIKEVRMTPKIDTHDFEVKVSAAEKFLKDGDKVKATVRFRGREIVHADLGKQLMLDMAQALKEICTVEREPKVEGKNLIMILAPRQE